jgi:integrase/recombinase XerD
LARNTVTGYCRILKARGKGGKTVLVPLPPAVARALDRAAAGRTSGPPLHPHMLRHTFVTTMLDAGVDLRDVQIAARHADPRITMRYDRARNQLDRHPNYILAAYMASGT